MKRRDILRYTAMMSGAVIAAPLAVSFLSGCKTDVLANAVDFQPSFFDAESFKFVNTIVDIIIPKTDSPSASEAGVPAIIDHMVNKVYNAEAQKEYKAGFDKLMSHLNSSEGFLNIQPTGQTEMIQKLEDGKDNPALKDVREAYINLKQQTVAYFLSNEKIAEKYLNYLEIPGAYEGCISLAEAGGKAWAIR
jgi:hypothetical protein